MRPHRGDELGPIDYAVPVCIESVHDRVDLRIAEWILSDGERGAELGRSEPAVLVLIEGVESESELVVRGRLARKPPRKKRGELAATHETGAGRVQEEK